MRETVVKREVFAVAVSSQGLHLKLREPPNLTCLVALDLQRLQK